MRKTGHHVADHVRVESACGTFPLKCCFAVAFMRVCVRHLRLLAEWSRETIILIMPRHCTKIKLNARTSYNTVATTMHLLKTFAVDLYS